MQFKRLNWNLSIADHRRKTASMPYPPNDRRTLSKEGKFEKSTARIISKNSKARWREKVTSWKLSRVHIQSTPCSIKTETPYSWWYLCQILIDSCQIFTNLIFFTGELSDKPLLIRLLTNPPHLKYVTTVHCNLSLIATLVCDCRSFSNINVSQGTGSGKERVY